MREFVVYPAIDLRRGCVVRLAQGDPDHETVYGTDPRLVAQAWEQAGAIWAHVVNLDGAFEQEGSRNQTAVAQILKTELLVQLGGGIRDMEALSRAFDLGVARVVIGTAFVRNPAFVAAALDRFGADRIAVGIDARDGVVRIRGWQESAGLSAVTLAQRWADLGGRWLVFTDISRDGMGSGVNVEATKALATETGLKVIASGGVRSLADIRRVRDAGLAGVIVGRALYEGQIKLVDALAAAEIS